ncbi:MAG TPA: DinB family protein [Thermoanaerobaculia bacterium]|nr:DinB family protein [Thermoanaerobaculia bacterium]
MEDQLAETWSIHDRINLYLLDAVAPAALASVSASKGRTVAEQFAHVHNVRLMWLGSAAPELLEGLEKIEKGAATDKDFLAAALTASGRAVEALLRKSLASGGRVKGFKPHAAAFLGYLISHESHHRGQIVLTLKQAGAPGGQEDGVRDLGVGGTVRDARACMPGL